jgi:hypothetical protein
MESAGREILEEPAGDGKTGWEAGEQGHRQKREGQHGGGTRRADVPMKIPSLKGPPGMEEDFGGIYFIPLERTAGKLAASSNGLQMLRPQPGFFSLGPDPGHVQGFPEESGEGDRIPQKGAASGVSRAVNLDHFV